MNRGIFIFILFASLYCTPAHAQKTRGTVAFVDYEQVFTNFYKTRLANDQLKQMQASYIEVRGTLIADLNEMLQSYKELRDGSIDESLTKEKRAVFRRNAESKLAEIRLQEKKIQNHDTSRDDKIDEQRTRIRIRYGDEIKERVRGYAKSKGYTAILDRTFVTGAEAPGVIYFDENADITAEVIKEINK